MEQAAIDVANPLIDFEWLDKQNIEKQAELLFKAFIARRHLTYAKVAKDLCVSEQLVKEMARGKTPLALDRMVRIQKVLNLSGDELATLNRLACVNRAPIDRMDALDPEWLTKQPLEKQAGLLLRAYRVRAYYTSAQLSAKLMMSRHCS